MREVVIVSRYQYSPAGQQPTIKFLLPFFNLKCCLNILLCFGMVDIMLTPEFIEKQLLENNYDFNIQDNTIIFFFQNLKRKSFHKSIITYANKSDYFPLAINTGVTEYIWNSNSIDFHVEMTIVIAMFPLFCQVCFSVGFGVGINTLRQQTHSNCI